MKTLFVRAASGLVFVALMVGGILWNQWSFGVLMSMVLAGSMLEFYKISAEKREPLSARPVFFIGAALLVYWVGFNLTSPPVRALPGGGNPLKLLWEVVAMQRDSALVFSVLVPMMLFVYFIAELFTRSTRPFENLGWHVVGVMYLLVPLLLTNKIFFDKGGLFLLSVFGIIWFYDSACYAFGSVLGRHKLLERISPKKTWEGLIGGFVLTLAVASWIHKIPGLDLLKPVQWVILAAVTITAATFGDLVESMLKRSLNVKDSGSIMPGHGGFLDRFDAYFLAVPFVSFVLWVFAQVDNLLLMINFLK